MISAWSGLGYTSPPSDITLTTSGSPYIWLVSRQLIYVSSDALCVCHQSLMSSSGVIVPCVICIHLPCGPGISQWSSAPPPPLTALRFTHSDPICNCRDPGSDKQGAIQIVVPTVQIGKEEKYTSYTIDVHYFILKVLWNNYLIYLLNITPWCSWAMKFCLSIITLVTLAGDNTYPANTRYREYSNRSK